MDEQTPHPPSYLGYPLPKGARAGFICFFPSPFQGEGGESSEPGEGHGPGFSGHDMHTPGTVKLLLPPRQSRGNSLLISRASARHARALAVSRRGALRKTQRPAPLLGALAAATECRPAGHSRLRLWLGRREPSG